MIFWKKKIYYTMDILIWLIWKMFLNIYCIIYYYNIVLLLKYSKYQPLYRIKINIILLIKVGEKMDKEKDLRNLIFKLGRYKGYEESGNAFELKIYEIEKTIRNIENDVLQSEVWSIYDKYYISDYKGDVDPEELCDFINDVFYRFLICYNTEQY